MMSHFKPSAKKRKVQATFIPLIYEDKVIGLPGEYVSEYLELFPPTMDFILYEKDHDIWEKIRSNGKVSVRNADILNSPVCKGAFYDFDFCCTARELNIYRLSKFKDNRMMLTFCVRKYSIVDTLIKVLYAMGEYPIKTISGEVYNTIITNKGKYLWKSYKATTPMITIFKTH